MEASPRKKTPRPTKKALRGQNLSPRRAPHLKSASSGRRYALAATEALHPACPHLQAISGVFSIASHSTLQYFPDVTVQEQTGCAHFLSSLAAIAVSPFINNSRLPY